MANLVQRLRAGRDLERQNPWPSVTFDQLPMWLGQFGYQGLGYGPALIQTYQANREAISADFMGFVKGAYKSNGPIFALMAFRLLMFSEARFQFRRMVNGRPGQLFGTAALEPLEHPWQNGTTGDLLARAITDVDIAGNFYATRVPGPKRGQVRIVRLRPDWVVIVLGSMEDTSVATYDPTAELIGYIYNRGGPGSGLTPHLYLPDEVAHFCVDEETEILTGEGWKSVDDLAVGDETLTLNHETGMAEWQAVSDVCIFDEQEREMISMEGREHSSLTTPGHRWSTEYKIARSGTFGKRWTTSSELAAGGSTGVRVPVAAPNGDLPKQATWPDALVELVAWYWTEGCSARDGKSLSISQSLVVNDENAQRIQGALTSLFGAPRADRTLAHDVARWRKGICGNNCIFTLNGAASRGIFEHVKGKEKIVSTSFLRSLTQAQLELFIKISLLADNNGPRRLKQASKLRSDQFALACLLAGYGVSIREDEHGMTGVRILKKRHFYLIERPRGFHVKTVKHTGRVWCPRTPNQTWLARRRGAVYFTGNSPYVDPTAHYRGISWLEPVLQEVLADRAMNTHRLQYFNNGASPNLVVSMETGKMDRKSFLEWIKLFESEHEGVANAYKCNAADTEVALWNGARCRADEIQVGDAIVSWTAEGRPAPGIVVRNDRQPASPIYTIRTARGRVIRVTDQHPFLLQGGVNRGARRTRSGWIEAKDLKPGDRLVVGLGWGRPRCQDVLTRDEAWMMGLLVGDGCFVSSTASVSASEPSIVARLGGIATLSPHQWRDQVLVSYYVSGISKMVRRLDLNGKRSWEKRVPTEVMTGGADVVAAFLSGYIDADGHVADPERRRSAEIGLTSTSRELLEDVRHLLASVGVNASISAPLSMRPGRGDFQNARQGYRLGVFGNDQARLLSDLLDLAHEEKARRLEAYSQIAARRDGSQVDRVESITIDPPEETIGLQVDPYHTHVTGGVVTKNTLYLGQGAQAQVVGNDLKQMDFKIVQGAGESRLAAAAGIPPVLVGFSEGLSAATYCLPADELVWTAQGPREICEIRAGDRVWSWVNDAPALRPVTWQGQTGVEHVYELRTKNRAFRATGSHPVLTVDGSWRRLDSLQAGDRVLEPLGLPDQGQTALPDGKPATGEVMQWLGAIIGDGSRVPGWVFELSEDLRLAFLAGVVDTDGSVDRRGALKIQQANRLLVEDLRMLMVTCGIQCSNIAEIRYGPECLPNSGAQDEYRAWMFTASSAVEVARIPFADLVYRERVEVNQHRHRPNTIGFRIRSITRSRAAVPVYDIEVDEGHSFLASGVVVHNSNYAMARRRLADMTLRPLWRNFCSSMETLITPPRGSQLWYDDRDIPALQEDVKDEAEIALTRATALKMLTDAGYTGDSAVMAVESNDFTVLEHSGLFSVQLLPPGTPKNSNGGPPHGGGTSSNQPGQQPSTLSNGTTPNTPSIGGGGSGSEGSGSGQSSVRLPPGVERATLSGNAEDLARAILAARARGEIPDD